MTLHLATLHPARQTTDPRVDPRRLNASALAELSQLDELSQLVPGALLRYHTLGSGRSRLVYVSEAAQDVWGLTASQVLANESLIWAMATRDQRQRVRAVFREATTYRRPWAHEWRIRDARGRDKWLRGTGKPRVQDDGSVLWTVFVHDVTDSVRARELEQASDDRFRRIFDSVPSIAVQMYGPDLIVRYWNEGSERLYGYTAAEAIGRSMLELIIPPALRAAFDRNFQHTHDGRTTLNTGVQWLNRKDGSAVQVQCNEIITEHPDRGIEIYCVDFDLTERHRAEAQRLTLQAQLRQSQKLEALGTLAGGIAHDFNNVLAAILGNARLAQEDAQDSPLVLQSLGEITKAGHRAREMVQRILSFSRGQTLQRRVVALADVVEESANLLRATIPRGVELDVACEPGTPLLLGDPTQLHQVLMNLCTNAWQAMPDRSKGRLAIRLAPHAGPPPRDADLRLDAGVPDNAWPAVNLCLTVSDDGCGMDADTLARLFEPFFTTKAPGEGTGLGLAVVHGILRDHQAAVRVRSAPGEGTTFSLYFRAADSQHADAASTTGPDSQGWQPSGPHAVTVLYVDDDPLIVDLMRRLLQRAGYQAFVFSEPRAALEAVQSGQVGYDLAITDFSMPGMDGLALARALRDARPGREVAITSGYISADLRRDAAASGITELIDKPNTGDELLAAIDRLARRRRYRVPLKDGSGR